MSDLLTAALIYAERGWAVFSLRGKVPWIAGGNGCYDATKDAAQLRAWWRDMPTANVGIATGKVSGLFVVDIDPDKDGDQTMRELIAKNGPLPLTTTVKTGGGGWHLYYAMPADVPITLGAGQIGAGIDHRGDGGYVVAPPSVHPDTGLTYGFVAGRRFKDIGVVAAPVWLCEAARRREWVFGDLVGTAASTDTLTEYGEAALRSAADNILNAPNGQQESTLNSEGYNIGRAVAAGLIPKELALRVLLIAARKIPDYEVSARTGKPLRSWAKGRPAQPGQPAILGEAEAKVSGAFNSGLKKPRASLADLEREWARIEAEAGDAWA